MTKELKYTNIPIYLYSITVVNALRDRFVNRGHYGGWFKIVQMPKVGILSNLFIIIKIRFLKKSFFLGTIFSNSLF